MLLALPDELVECVCGALVRRGHLSDALAHLLVCSKATRAAAIHVLQLLGSGVRASAVVMPALLTHASQLPKMCAPPSLVGVVQNTEKVRRIYELLHAVWPHHVEVDAKLPAGRWRLCSTRLTLVLRDVPRDVQLVVNKRACVRMSVHGAVAWNLRMAGARALEVRHLELHLRMRAKFMLFQLEQATYVLPEVTRSITVTVGTRIHEFHLCYKLLTLLLCEEDGVVVHLRNVFQWEGAGVRRAFAQLLRVHAVGRHLVIDRCTRAVQEALHRNGVNCIVDCFVA